ncbi:MAG TPA: MFS transporter [Anaerolineales bacterium]|nr:MFS transporter [Anaerolineales bacterium]
MISSFRALRLRPFALLWSGQTISRLGDRFYQVALVWWVLEKTGSAVVMGTVLIFFEVPMLIFALLGGALVDRWPRLPVMMLSDLLRGLTVGIMAALAYANLLQVWHIYVISLIFGMVDAFFQPAYRASVPEIVPVEHLPSANSLTSLSGEVCGIIGPALGAGMVALGGTSSAFALDALSFIISAVCLLPILRLSGSPRREERAGSILRDVRAGLGTVFASPWLWITIGVAGISNITYVGPMDVALPFLIKDHLHGQVGVLGLFYTCMSVGALLAAFWLGRTTRIRKRGLKMYGVWMLIGVMVVLIGLPISIPGVLAAAFVIGGANTALSLIWVNTLQEQVPRELQGRVSSVDFLGSSLLAPVGYAIGGWATAILGPVLIFIVGGILQTGLIGLGLLHPKIRALD